MKSLDGTDPAGWDPRRDAVVAAPDHHAVVYEDDLIRVLAIHIAPGTTEPVHHHRWPCVFIIDRQAKLRHFDGEGKEIPRPAPDSDDLPLTLKLPPQPLHAARNDDSTAFHGIRIEFKGGF